MSYYANIKQVLTNIFRSEDQIEIKRHLFGLCWDFSLRSMDMRRTCVVFLWTTDWRWLIKAKTTRPQLVQKLCVPNCDWSWQGECLLSKYWLRSEMVIYLQRGTLRPRCCSKKTKSKNGWWSLGGCDLVRFRTVKFSVVRNMSGTGSSVAT